MNKQFASPIVVFHLTYYVTLLFFKPKVLKLPETIAMILELAEPDSTVKSERIMHYGGDPWCKLIFTKPIST